MCVCVCASLHQYGLGLYTVERGLTSLHSQGISVKLQRCGSVIFTAVGSPPPGCEIFTRYQMKISAAAGQFVQKLSCWKHITYTTVSKQSV